jgi:hypothetical protein
MGFDSVNLHRPTGVGGVTELSELDPSSSPRTQSSTPTANPVIGIGGIGIPPPPPAPPLPPGKGKSSKSSPSAAPASV